METQVKVLEVGQLYGTVADIADAFGLGQTHVRALVDAMAKDCTYGGGVVRYGRIVRIKFSDFEKFWKKYAERR
ncbi:MAG: hypothetical protein VZQ81_01860 [Succiniclasticum sp.]|nr:hypothetical protein [Succiniclasticum sp.]